jgi:PAS domain-containing protein
VTCEWLDGITRIQLSARQRDSADADGAGAPANGELEALRQAVNQAPNPAWCVDHSGEVAWYNPAYEILYRKSRGCNPVPGVPLFPAIERDRLSGKKVRKSIPVKGSNQNLWFDVTVVRNESNCQCYAVDINAVVAAEIAQRNFVQTLAKTFAQLSIGLAIFDRNRQLALFNPALVELTSLPADFLTARPNLLSFFDRLRDQRIMPEPKNYDSWRQQMADLVDAAANGLYMETWSLPSGSVYSVSGRPHPDGAVAFLFEDITAEITLTRRFRSDLELGQSILDQLDQAIAVFAADGTLTFSNAAYRGLWQVDPDKTFAQITVLDATRTWQDNCRASPVWGEIRDFVAVRENRAEWWADVTLGSGKSLVCNICPILNGATMVSFAAATARERVPVAARPEAPANG